MESTEEQIKKSFYESRKLLIAIGDETRQAIIAILMESEKKGMRVGEITELTNLSRPAISHHLKILLDTEVIDVCSEGTKNFYFLKLGGAWSSFVELVNSIEQFRIATANN
jgi:ArsR family transcriptional regulator